MKRGDNIPPKDADFDSFQSNLITQVTANTAAWGIMAAALALLLPLQMAWAAAWSIAKIKVNRSPGAVATKNQARAAYVTALRMFLRSNIFGNPLMTPGDIELCGLKPYDHTRTPIPVPVVQPIVNLQRASGNYFWVRFYRLDDETGAIHRGKPDHVAKIEFAFTITGQPANPEACTDFRTATRGPIHVEVPLNFSGQTIWFYARWKNVYDKPGPWTDLNFFRF